MYVRQPNIIPHRSECLFLVLNTFFLFSLHGIISIDLSSNSTIFSAISNLLFIPSCEIFISDILIFSSNICIIFCLIFCISLLRVSSCSLNMTVFYFKSLNTSKEVVLKVFSNNFNILSISESAGLFLLTDFPLDLGVIILFCIFSDVCYIQGFPDSWVRKESTCNTGDPDLIPRSGRSPGEGIGYPLQDSWTSLVSQLVESTCNAGDLGSIHGLGRSSHDLVEDTSVRSWILNCSLGTIAFLLFFSIRYWLY